MQEEAEFVGVELRVGLGLELMVLRGLVKGVEMFEQIEQV
jgi:hypothetical protein